MDRHKRKFCPHCNEVLSYSCYRSHKALYYSDSEQQWLRTNEVRCGVGMDSDPDHAASNNEDFEFESSSLINICKLLASLICNSPSMLGEAVATSNNILGDFESDCSGPGIDSESDHESVSGTMNSVVCTIDVFSKPDLEEKLNVIVEEIDNDETDDDLCPSRLLNRVTGIILTFLCFV